jgi:hypothetical protein
MFWLSPHQIFLQQKVNENTYNKELSRVFIGVSDADGAAVDANISANTEVLGHERAHSVTFEDHLAIEESTLG